MSGFISIADFGAKGDGKTDSRAAIQKAFDYAKAHGVDVFIPAGTFLHSGTLTADGIRVFGAGESSILKASTYGQEALYLKGTGVALSDLHMIGFGGARLQADPSQKVVVQGAQDFTIERVHIEKTSTGGIKVNGSANGYIADNLIENTHADSIHMTNASHHILVERNRVLYSGDDGIAVVSYGGAGGSPNHSITIRDNDVRYNTWGRGISVIGGNDVLIEHNNIAGGTNDRAGIYIAAELQYNTQSVHNVRVTGNTITDAGGMSTGHGAITLYNSQGGGFVVDGVTVTGNDIVNPRKAGIAVIGSGTQKLAIYDNTLAGGKYGLLVNADPKAQISTAKPSTEKNILGTEGADQFPGTANSDAIYGRGGDDTLRGEGGDDLLVGGAGNDRLIGGVGNDRLDGADGNDTLDGGAGNDLLVGGAGADTFVFTRGSGQDRIISFQSGVDKLDLRSFGFATLDQLKQGATITSGHEASGGAFVTLNFGNGDSLKVMGIGSLAAGDILFGSGGTTPPPAPTPTEITGTAGNDALVGTEGADTISGAGGNDSLRGGKGNDTLSGGAGDDTYVGERNGGMDRINWFEAGDKIDVKAFGWKSLAEMQAAGVTMTAGTEGDGSSSVTVNFGNGDGFKVVGVGSLAAGNFVFAPGGTTPPPAPNPQEIVGTDGNDTLTGGDAADTIWGDKTAGVGGSDRLRGGKGNDYLSGGGGSDVYVGERGGGMDTVRWFEAGEKIDVSLFGWKSFSEMQAAGMTMTSGIDASTLNQAFVAVNFGSGDGFKVYGVSSLAAANFIFASGGTTPPPSTDIIGTAGNDTLSGTSSNDVLRGEAGNDKLDGRLGDDVLVGGAGNDTLIGGGGSDTAVYSGLFADYSITTSGATSTVKDLKPTVTGDDGTDTLTGITKLQFADRAVTLETSSTITGTAGNDVLTGKDGVNDVIKGGAGDDTLRGLSGDDVLQGDAGNDQLFGDAGNDRLIGDAGIDILNGGAGADTFVLSRGMNVDVIAGFEDGADKLDLSAFGFKGIADLTSKVQSTGPTTLFVDFGGGDQLHLFGIGKLTADNVIF